ncbi:DegV family protein [Haloplasma contractile]|uniref:Protein DegV n=1 Tax=Haloplasma contractile SSD-17B TaxID=1033810 RepID=U2DXU1_9MOLU|nr:DegV family protein [Haloplasma contractile]ERJ13077.1 Protein DegV [Haloplasma contractile SSD-17B]
MSKIAIVTDSTSGIDFIDGYDDIKIARTTLIMDQDEYLDGLEITPKEFYDRLENLNNIPMTSQPSIGILVEIFEELKKEGYTDAIYVCISEHLSGTFQSVCMAANMVEGINVHPFNTQTATFIAGFMATEAHRMASVGESVEAIIQYLETLRDNDRIVLMVDDLKYLVKNGRLSNASGFIASALKIKPLLELNEEGKIVATEKIRTTKKAINRVIESYLEDTNDGKDAKFTFLFNTEAPEHVEYVKSKLSDIGIDTDQFIDIPVSPAIGCHVGKGVIGIGYIKKSN